MKKKIIGISIIAISALLLFGIGYTIFIDDSFLNSLLGRVKPGNAPLSGVHSTSQNNFNTAASGTGQAPLKKIEAKMNNNSGQSAENKNKPSKRQIAKNDLKRMAASFAERFGSYSNQSNFSNITDLKLFMSRRMKNWADNFIRQQRQQVQNNSIYYGITTKAVAEEINEYDDDAGKTIILVETRRRESSGTIANAAKAFNQKIIVTLIKENGAWKIDSAVWQ